MKKALFACLLCLLFCAGCAQQDGTAVSDAPVVEMPPEIETPPAVSEPEPSPEPTPAEEAETPGVAPYTLDCAVTVDGRALTLRLHGRVDTTDGFERIGIRVIDVLEGDALLQTLSMRDAFDELYRQEGIELPEPTEWTDCWTQDGSLTLDDLNFDGFPDIRLMGTAGTVNITYLCWLWDVQTEQFDYAFSLVGYDVQIDSVAQLLITQHRDGYGQYYTDYYRYDNQSKTLLLMKQILEDMVNQTTSVHEQVDGVWTQSMA